MHERVCGGERSKSRTACHVSQTERAGEQVRGGESESEKEEEQNDRVEKKWLV